MDNQSTHLDSGEPENRAVIIAGLRAMADFLEARTDVPLGAYDSFELQHSILHGSNDEKIAEVRRIGGLLGVETKIYDDRTGVVSRYQVADRTTFVVHALLDSGEQA